MISTMNTRTGNAQSLGDSQLELEEDAMLTAIGQSSLDEMADKYASRWDEFMESLSRWRSLHQFLRLYRLNYLNNALKGIKQGLGDIRYVISGLIKQIDTTSPLAEYRKEIALDIANRLQHTGKSQKQRYDLATECTIALVLAEQDPRYLERKAKLESARPYLEAARDENERVLAKKRQEHMQIQDQYDITKPYAMGLLVADIFYTLASAIQGEIYL